MGVAIQALAARVFSVLAAILVAFLVSPEVFGVYGRLQMLGLLFTVIGFLRLERAVVAAPSLADAVNASKAGLVLMPVLAVMMVGLSLMALPGSLSGHGLAALCAMSFAGRSLILLTHSWLSRWGRPKSINALIFLQAGVQIVIQLVLLGSGIVSLIALILGEIAGALAVVSAAWLKGRTLVVRILRKRRVFGVLASQRWLPLANLPAALFSQMLTALPLMAYGHLADSLSTGHFALAWRVVEAPMQMIAATATSLAVATGLWSSRRLVRNDRHAAMIYVSLIVGIGAALILASYLAAPFLVDHAGHILGVPISRLSGTAAFIPVAVLLTAGIALGGPHSDLVSYAGAERPALIVHAGALCAALTVYVFAPENPMDMLLLFGAVMVLRSLCLWLLLPLALRRRSFQRAVPIQPKLRKEI